MLAENSDTEGKDNLYSPPATPEKSELGWQPRNFPLTLNPRKERSNGEEGLGLYGIKNKTFHLDGKRVVNEGLRPHHAFLPRQDENKTWVVRTEGW